MLKVSSKDVIARIRTELRVGDVVAFDGDGTLWDGDVGDEFFFALLAHNDVREPAKTRLVDEARVACMDTEGTPVEIAKRIFAAYTAGQYSERKVCEMIGWLCAGWSLAEVTGFADKMIPSGALEARLHAEAIEVGVAVKALGGRVVIVSASPRHIVEAAARRVGFTADVIATTPRYTNDTMLPSVDEPIPYDEGKVTNLRAYLGEGALVAAFGDNAFDVPMLRAAKVAVAVRPKERLLARTADVPGLLTIDRSSASSA